MPGTPFLLTPKMKTLVSLLAAALSGLAFAATPTGPGAVPEGLASSDWSDIHAAYEAARHAPQRQDGGHLVARNPGQQWRTEFDGKGFTVTPDHGSWTWGLELTGYGDRKLPSAASFSQLRHEGGKITCQRDENLSEWFINDSRGLEQGWDIRRRPGRADPAAPLQLHLSTRGSVRPQVSDGGDSVSFQQESGDKALSYGGLKAWDADGRKLSVRFEAADGNRICIAVDDQSARYPITIDPIAQQAFVKASNYGEDDRFGRSVAISGDTVVIGAPNEDSAATGANGDQTSNAASNSGAVYVFVRTGATWAQQAYLKASNPGTDDQFGCSVAISGDTVIVGAVEEDSAATGVNGDQSNNGAVFSGAAYVFTRNGTTWTQQAYLKASNTGAEDAFGESVAISGDTAVVGARGEGSNATGVNGNQSNNSAGGAGAVYVFTRSGTAWTQQAYLKASNAEANDFFGCSVAISGDTMVAGASREDSTAPGVNGDQSNNAGAYVGAAYVFVRNGTAWTQQAYLKASNPSISSSWWDGYEFGEAVAISGDTVVVGSSQEDRATSGVNGTPAGYVMNAGAAYVFARNGTMWSQQAYLKAHDPAQNSYFGRCVGISGDKVVVGSRFVNNLQTFGSAYVFSRNGTSWTQLALLPASSIGAWVVPVGISGETVVMGTDEAGDGGTGVTRIQAAGQTFSYQSGVAYITQLDVPTAPPAITVRMSGSPITNGGTAACGPAVIDTSREITIEIANPGTAPYIPAPGPLALTGTPAVAIAGDSDFTVSIQPALNPVLSGQSTSFKVRFAPASEGAKSATLTIPSNHVDGDNPFIIPLTGRGLSFTTDTDGDGLNDAAEFNLAALNFNWQLSQTAMVNAYSADVNRRQLYTPEQIQALHPGTALIARDPASGRFKVTAHWEKSTNLADFFDFPAPVGSSVSISPSGGVELEFASPENAAFFRIEQD